MAGLERQLDYLYSEIEMLQCRICILRFATTYLTNDQEMPDQCLLTNLHKQIEDLQSQIATIQCQICDQWLSRLKDPLKPIVDLQPQIATLQRQIDDLNHGMNSTTCGFDDQPSSLDEEGKPPLLEQQHSVPRGAEGGFCSTEPTSSADGIPTYIESSEFEDGYDPNLKSPMYRRFTNIDDRSRSFRGWPRENSHSANKMAKAGFFFTDSTTCGFDDQPSSLDEEGKPPLLEQQHSVPRGAEGGFCSTDSTTCGFDDQPSSLDEEGKPPLLEQQHSVPRGAEGGFGSTEPTCSADGIPTDIVSSEFEDGHNTREISPMYPRYANEDDRSRSFRGWPHANSHSANKMAKAGFFFTGHGDRTRCYFCGGCLHKWEPGDDPLKEHMRCFPLCEYIRHLKEDIPVASGLSPDEENERGREGSNNGDDMPIIDTDCGKTLLSFGYTPERIIHVVETLRRQTGNAMVSAEQAFRYILLDEEKGGPPLPSDAKIKSLTEENQRLRHMITCKVCLDKTVDTILLPCGHHFCQTCANELTMCAICREDIQNRVLSYLS